MSERRWPLVAAQIAPLVVVAAILLVVFSVPNSMLSTTADILGNPKSTVSSADLRLVVTNEEAARIAKMAQLNDGTSKSLESALEYSWDLTAARQREFVTTTAIAPLPFSFDATSFSPIRDWERRHDAVVWAWVVTPSPTISLVTSAPPDAKTMAYLRREVVPMLPADNVTTPSGWTDSLGRTPLQIAYLNLAMNTQPTSGMVPLDTSQFQATGGQDVATVSGSDMGNITVSIGRTTIAQGGQFYRVVIATAGPSTPGGDPTAMPTDLLGADPTAPGFAALVARVAARDNLGIWVFGPMGSLATPFRAPSTVSTATAAQAGAALWPAFAATNPSSVFDALGPLSPETARLTGGTFGALRVINSSMSYDPNEDPNHPAQAIAYLAVFRDRPGGSPGPLRRAFAAWSLWLAGYFPAVIGGLFALLGVSLVVSPFAFTYDRRQRARRRVREEMERRQRDAHDKVYNRLSALSKRVGQAGDGAHADLARSLSTIADDIRSTVGELQAILGDEGEHTDTSLATVPLAEQISAVCRAQSARLGVQVVFRAPDDLPELSPRAGWDLQCIAEEAITNAVRHGHARTVEVALEATADSVVLRVADDGRGPEGGITIDELPPGSTGLRGAAARVARRGGTLDVRSGVGGTTVVAKVPVDASSEGD